MAIEEAKEILSNVSDGGDLYDILLTSSDLNVRIAAISTLLQGARSFERVLFIHDEIAETIELFLDQLRDAVPSNLEGVEGYLFNIIDEFDTRESPAELFSQELPVWKWPAVEGAVLESGHIDGRFREKSALKLFGYTVGKKAGWPTDKRQRFLSDFIEMPLPGIVRENYEDDYGEPLSTQRLRAVATILAANASLRLRSDPVKYAFAIGDWKSDLEFLRKKYYVGMGLQFKPWPTISHK